MRLFVAGSVDRNIRENISLWQKKFEDFPLRPIPRENLHITFIAPWNTQNVDEAEEILHTLIWDEGAIPVKIDEIVTKKSLAWAHVKEDKKLYMLRKRLHRIYEKKEERRRHKFHITLARYNNGYVTRQMKREMKSKLDWNMTIRDIVLFRSDLTPEGAIHTPLTQISL